MSIQQARKFVAENRPVCLLVMRALSHIAKFDKAPNPFKGLRELNDDDATEHVLVTILWYMSYTKHYTDKTVKQFLKHMNEIRNRDKVLMLTRLQTIDETVKYDLAEMVIPLSRLKFNVNDDDCNESSNPSQSTLNKELMCMEPQSGMELPFSRTKNMFCRFNESKRDCGDFWKQSSVFTKVSWVATAATITMPLVTGVSLPISLALIKQVGNIALTSSVFDLLKYSNDNTRDNLHTALNNQHLNIKKFDAQSGLEGMDTSFMNQIDAQAFTKGTRAQDLNGNLNQQVSRMPTGQYAVQADNDTAIESLNQVFQRSYGTLKNSNNIRPKSHFSGRPSNINGL